MKIIDKINDFIAKDEPFFSFEFFPPKTEAGVHNLYARLERMADLEPAFIDVTWGAGGTTSDLSLEISKTAQEYFGLEVMMHLTCTNMPATKIDDALSGAKDAGLTNILALRGDPPKGKKKFEQVEGGFAYGSDLTRHIREQHGDYFGIAVGGYPEGHLEAGGKDKDIENLKIKMDAGADFIVTQLFYDIEEYFDFVERARKAGITAPIIPGLLPIQGYDRFKRFTDFCQIKIPQHVKDRLEPIKNDDAAVKRYGIELCVDMARELREYGAPGFHFYTLNLESSVTTILKELGLVKDDEARRALPWRPSAHPDREHEDVRPIFWSNRPKSYLARTMDWDDFPNGRWGDSRSPSFGDLKDYYLLQRGLGSAEDEEKRRQMWGAPKTVDDVREVFVDFCEGRINRFPWCEGEVHQETGRILDPLVRLNRGGFLTINSQPQVNGARSEDPEVGWGPAGGRVFQKAYIEFFISPELLKRFLECVEEFPSLSYQATNVKGETITNLGEEKSVNALTWGAFPGREIVQPTVVDSEVFMIWKEEAFQTWLEEWAHLYDDDSPSTKLLKEIHDSYYLMHVVENDFVEGDIFRAFEMTLSGRNKRRA